MKPPFRIKICGVTRPADAALAAEAGADALGLNFYAKSPRYVSLDQAAAIAAALPAGVKRVGVFVNADPAEIRRLASHVPLDLVQLHGDEKPEIVDSLVGLALVRAFRCHAGQVDHVQAWLDEARRRGADLHAALIDAYHPTEYGGTGKTADWSLLDKLRAAGVDLPLVLAGGLTSDNVAEAIRIARPDAIDTASGVEAGPGVKDDEKVRAFVRNAALGWGAV